MSLIKLINFQYSGDNRGGIVFLEENNEIPFEIKRVYYILNTPKGVSRGFHAHKKLEQVLICISGSCEITLDNGTKRESTIMNMPNVGLYMGNNIWREIHNISEDCIILVVASELYDENDYFRDYDNFLSHLTKLSND